MASTDKKEGTKINGPMPDDFFPLKSGKSLSKGTKKALKKRAKSMGKGRK